MTRRFRKDLIAAGRESRAVRASTETTNALTAATPVAGSLHLAVVASLSARKYRVRVLASGFGANSEGGRRWFVPDSVEGIGSAKRTFAGAKVHYYRDASGNFDHRGETALATWMDADHEVGHLTDLELVAGELHASLVLHDDVPKEIVEVIAAKRVGLSIEAHAERRPGIRDGQPVVDLVNFRHGPDGPASVALVTHPALRGEILRVAASRKEQKPMSDSATVVAPDFTKEREQIAADLKAAADAKTEIERLRLQAAASSARAEMNAKLVESKLPEGACGLIAAALSNSIDSTGKLDVEKLDAHIKAARDLISKTEESAKVKGAGSVTVGAGALDKFRLGCERLILGMDPGERVLRRYADFDVKHAKGRVLASREQEAGIGRTDQCYSWTRLVRESLGVDLSDLYRSGAEGRRIRASINIAQWGDVFENVLNIAGYAFQENQDFGTWRKITTQVPITGTKKQERVTTFGYANLPTVTEGAAYVAATSPGDHGHGYTPVKKGYTEDWTREAQMNDNVGALQGIVRKMAVAADRTVYEYVFDQITIAGDPTMDYDSTALFHSTTHANLNTSPLTATSLAAARLAMVKQADPSSSKRLGVYPGFLLVPLDKEETARNLLKPKAEEPGGLTSERAFIRTLNLEIIPVIHWTNTTDWFLVADPRTSPIPVFEMGFENGRQMADIFVQDMTNVGSVFDRDAVTVAIKQPYFGGSPLRHEAFYANDSAS